jgi:hypothetical protein
MQFLEVGVSRTVAAIGLGLSALLSTAAMAAMAANGYGYDSAAYDYDSGFYIGASAGETFSLNTSSSKAAAGTSSASTNPAIASLNSTYSKLMTDLGGAANATCAQSSGATLQAMLQNMLQHEQQQGSWGASIGHAVHAVA